LFLAQRLLILDALAGKPWVKSCVAKLFSNLGDERNSGETDMGDQARNLALSSPVPIRDECFNPSGSAEFRRQEVEQSIPNRFEIIVKQFPERIAVKVKSRIVTYSELNAMANRVAHAILSKQSREGRPVGILLEKGIEQVAAMLGILKAGKFFVLLDVGFPPSRIAALVADSEAEVVISDRQFSSGTAGESNSDFEFLLFESMAASGRAENPCLNISPADIACISYTSGSTGQPKGVIQTHRNLLHEYIVRTRSSAVNEQDRIALLSASTANAISNTFQALLTGATLCPFDVKNEGVHRLASWLVEEKITVCLISSTLFRALCQTLAGAQDFSDLRFLRLRSESARKTEVEQFKKYFSPKCVLVHGLSSSETWALCEYRIGHDTKIPGDELPVGYPVQDKEILLVDEEGRELGPNAVGEIVVRSRYLSPGYWRRPDLTKLRFKADPSDPAKRLYYTGDLGTALADGCLIHKGRKDFRIKIRGYGVDLTEVEQALREHAMVKEAVIISNQSESGEERLIAYVVTDGRVKLNVSELRIFLRSKLPDYMIPSIFVALDTIPLTSSGKIDRMHLPPPAPRRPELIHSYAAPRNLTEEKLEKIWARILGVDRVGIHDDFFDLGGHSLLAVRLISEVELSFGKNIPPSLFIKSPTIAELASVLGKQEQAAISPLIAIQPTGSNLPFFCAHGTDCYGPLARYLGPDQPFYGLAQHLEGKRVRYTSIETIAAHYVREIRKVQPTGPFYIGGHSIGGLIAFEMAQQLQKADQEVRLLVVMDSGSPPKTQPAGKNGARHASGTRSLAESLTLRRLERDLWLMRHRVMETLRYDTKAAACEIYHHLGMRLPPALKTFYVDQVVYGKIYPEAHRNYAPRPYSGQAIYLKSEDTRERVTGWEKLMTNGLEIRPVKGNHLTMLVEPNLRSLGETLRECLAKAQKLTRSKSRSTELRGLAGTKADESLFESTPAQ
jgi:amino acid adenylation domain-containing protein